MLVEKHEKDLPTTPLLILLTGSSVEKSGQDKVNTEKKLVLGTEGYSLKSSRKDVPRRCVTLHLDYKILNS